MKPLNIFLFLFLMNSHYSQNIISGKIVNSENIPVDFGEIIFFNLDSTLFKTGLSDENGRFSINAGLGSYIFQVRQEAKLVFDSTLVITSSIDLGTISVSSIKLVEVVNVIYKKPTIERKVDRLIFNVENSISASGGDALDVLKVTPNVKVQENLLKIIGKSNLLVMVNDKMIQLSGEDLINYLKTIPSNSIQKIEVITTPPSKYDAAGNSGLINIVLKKTIKNSWNGSLGANVIKRTYFSESLNGNFNLNRNKITFQSSFSSGSGKKLNSEVNKIYYKDETWSQRNPIIVKNEFLIFRTGIDYKINKRSTVGIQYLGNLSKSDLTNNSLTSITNESSNNIDSYIESDSKTKKTPNLHSLNVHSGFDLDTNGSKMTIDIDYLQFDLINSRNYAGNKLDYDSVISPGTYFSAINSNDQKIENLSSKIDFEIPCKWLELSAGGKIYQSRTNNYIRFYSNETGIPILSSDLSNRFKYTENYQALYISGNKKMKEKFEIQVGLRMEATQTKGYSENYDQTTFKKYVKLFPTAYLAYYLNDDNTFSLNYSRRIDRPNYESVNPFRIYDNPYSYSEGNPFLSPSFTNNIEFNYSYKNLEVSISYQNTTQSFEQIGIVDTLTNITRYFVLNFLTTNNYVASISHTFDKFNRWNSINSFDIGNSTSFSTIPQTQKTLNGFYAYFSTSNDFNLNKNKTFLCNVSFWHEFKGVTGLDYFSPSSSLSVALKILLLKKKLQISLAGNDILKTQRPTITFYSNGIKQEYKNYFDTQSVKFSIVYKIGNTKLKVNQKEFGNETEKNRIIQ